MITNWRSVATSRYWKFSFQSHARSGGNWNFTGQLTGLGLSDFMMGRVGRLEHGGPALLPMNQWYMGLYAQDTWRMSPRVTLNAGLRWEPYFGQSVTSGAIYNFSRENFRNNVRSQQFVNAPAGFIYPGDAGFPGGLARHQQAVVELLPTRRFRLGRRRRRPHRGARVVRAHL